MSKKNILNNQINELEEKIQTTKTDQHIFSIIEDNNFLKPLIHLERLQKFADNTYQNIRTLEKERDKKDVDKLNSELHKEKIKILEKKYILDLNAQYEAQDTALQVEKDYRDQIKKEIKIISDIKTREYLSQLAQNERALRFNAIDRRQLIAKIEIEKLNTNQEKERQKLNTHLNQMEDLLLQNIVETSQNNNTQENIFFDSLKIQLISLKDQVENTVWNKSGWGFFSKKFLMVFKKFARFSIQNLLTLQT